jgi:transcription-repair coupling factor (superfamily II helicase)
MSSCSTDLSRLADLGRDKTVAEVARRIAAGDGRAVSVHGTWGSFSAMLAAYLRRLSGRPLVFITPHIDDADRAADDLQTFAGQRAEVLSACEGPEDLLDTADPVCSERLRLVLRASDPQCGLLAACSIQAICQPVPGPKALAEGRLVLEAGSVKRPGDIARYLADNGFERVERIDVPGQFARRGGILDIFAPVVAGADPGPGDAGRVAEALRIEFFGDRVEQIRRIDPDSYVSTGRLRHVEIFGARLARAADRGLFLDALPAGTLLVIEQPVDVEQAAIVSRGRSQDQSWLYPWRDVAPALQKFTRLEISRFAASPGGGGLGLEVGSVHHIQHKTGDFFTGKKQALDQLADEARSRKPVLFYCQSAAEIERITEIVTEGGSPLPEDFHLLRGFVNQGFVVKSLDATVISHHELFGQYLIRRTQRPMRAAAPVDTLADLEAGDYVVHLSHGIGKFLGTETIRDGDRVSEYLTVEYADRARVRVSVSNIALVQKYIGTSPRRPKLSRIGSAKWQRQKKKAAESVRSIACEMLSIQARRQACGGIAYGEDSEWQAQFEQSFPYSETPDQIAAADRIKEDMRRAVAMDRLLCGDVGYGKTELAMRAAFKAIAGGRQVAVLVPTTVLSVQHRRTFAERFADFPVCVEVLNRFKTRGQTGEIIRRTKEGKVDVLIGTHRLLSGDVGFRDLGLVIIDEEQRFGVEHKEKLKRLRANVDILTMTATPIPRTLHMALLGLRDISSLATPPLDRRSIVTSVVPYDPGMVRKAIGHEVDRRGQVFFVHNRVKTIDRKAREIRRILGDGFSGVNVAVAHGRMPKSQLESTMIDFVNGRVDVLVCTTIIESGLDIPNANTIFIDEADRFGLAELHQLRGRVGRYKQKAYAYLLLPAGRCVVPMAARRLKAIEDYSYLGAGFKIALRDMEIRGAGNILGPEQSGHIQAVGYQLYCELLAGAVRQLKNEPQPAVGQTKLELGFSAYIPGGYMPSERYRMDLYRKIATAASAEDLERVAAETADICGPLPGELKMLLETARLRITAASRGIRSIVASGRDLVFSFQKGVDPAAAAAFDAAAGKVEVRDARTISLRLPDGRLEPEEVMRILRKMLSDRRN